ncbi:MAG: hypothetical protein CVU73_08295 [Deltaproteobacteria bacterium HGW-Deltaproteobacteria-8]|jgi:Tfp pilus assembly protein PilF|nr:MAG: hypothetical protein CVU73_08295 [Deltaproteobacteria bacterium HGW-Deltaproteobacteria-8]
MTNPRAIQTPCALRLLSLALLLTTLTALASGCALPRIVVHDDPLSAGEHLKLGMAYESGGEPERAAAEYRLAARKEPLARLYLGNVLFGQGQLDDAETEYRAAVKGLPDNPEALNNLAWLLYTRKSDLAEAEALAVKAVTLAPARPAFQDTLKAIRAAQGQ